MTNLKIILATRAPFIAGAEVAAERLALGLQDEGHDVLMLVGDDGEALKRYCGRGLRCKHLPMVMTEKWKFWQTLSARRALSKVLSDENPDVVHANDHPTSQMIGWSVRRAGIPLVCHHRWTFEAGAIDWLNKYGADLHMFVSEYLMQDQCTNSRTLRNSTCKVVYDGLPVAPIAVNQSQRLEARDSLGLPRNQTLVLFAGQIVERKGIEDALRAWSLLKNNLRSTSEFHVIGDDLESNGAYREKMQWLNSELNCGAVFHGFRKDVASWLTASDIVLVPSHVEPLGNATLEAMALGLPVVGTEVGGIPEMIVDNKTGLLVEAKSPKQLSNAIARLIEQPEMQSTLGLAANERCKDLFSQQTHVRNVLSQYAVLFKKNGFSSRKMQRLIQAS